MGLTVQSHASMIILDINVKINVTVRITKSAINTSVVKQLVSSFKNFLIRVSCTLKVCNELLMNRHGCINFFHSWTYNKLYHLFTNTKFKTSLYSIIQQQGKILKLDMTSLFACISYSRPVLLKKKIRITLFYIFFFKNLC